MKLKVKYSLNKDLDTYLCLLGESDDTYSYGRKDANKSNIANLPEKVQEILSKDEDVSVIENKLRKYLKTYYEKNKKQIGKSKKWLEERWERVGDQILYRFEEFYGRPMPFEEATAYITSNVYFSYDVDSGYFHIPLAHTTVQLSVAKHELCHFMFHHYYADLEEKLGSKNFHLIKESFTFFTSPEMTGYPAESKLRKIYMSRKWKSADEAVEAAVKLLNT